jgi:putative tricarboxylic transport membrane protein
MAVRINYHCRVAKFGIPFVPPQSHPMISKPLFIALFAALTTFAVATFACGARAADWKPDKRIEIVVPNAAGGGNDRIARLVQHVAQEKRFVDPVMTITNKPGAGQVIGIGYVNQHAGDGHYIGIISATFLGDIISGRSQLGLADIAPIAQLFTEYVGFAVRTDSPLKTGRDLVARLKAGAGSISTAISGVIGNHNYIALALVARAAGGDVKKLKVVTFNGGAEGITAALGGHVDMVVAPAATLLPHVQSGGLRMLAIAAPKRLAGAYADVPATKELGVDATLANWRVMIGPRGMPAPQIAYWENVFARVVATDEWKSMLDKDSLTGEFLRSAETRTQLQSEYGELKTVMTELGLVKASPPVHCAPSAPCP